MADVETRITPPLWPKARWLINKSECKRYLLAVSRAERGGKFTRVSAEEIASINRRLRKMLQDDVRAHPSRGKTIMENE